MSKTFKCVAKSTSLVAALLVGVGTAAANSPRSNADQVKDVTVSQEGINLHVTLKNMSANKHVDSIQIAPESSVMNIPLKGYVTCAKDKDIDFLSSRAYFGTVHRQGQNIQPVNSLYDATYHPTFSDWTGLLGGWIAEGGNQTPFAVPLNKVKNGHPAVRFDPVELFNAKLQAHIGNGGSKLDFLKKDQFMTVNRPISLAGTCREDNAVNGSGYSTVTVPLNIRYKGDASLFGGMGGASAANKFDFPFQVTSANVTPHVKDYVGQCPTDLKFRLSVEAQGAGSVKYRIVSELGAKGSVKTLKFSESHNGKRILDFTRAIQELNKGGINNIKVAAPAQNQGNINQFEANPTDKKSGSWRVEILEPQSLVSDESFYSWKCETPKQPVKFKAAKPQPVDPKPIVPNKLTLKIN